MPHVAAILTIVAAYLLGAVPFGYLVARARGINIFEHGSKNIGATNVGRVLGMRFGLLVFMLDFLKGAVPVFVAIELKPFFDDDLWRRGYVEVAAGLAAFLGHIFPIYLRLKGGKGVAAGFGAILVLLPMPTLIAFAVWTVVLVSTRYMSLASITSVVVLCLAHLMRPWAWSMEEPRTWFALVAGGIAIVKHHANVKRLLTGTENQLKETIVMQQLCKSLHTLALGMWFGMSVFFTFVVAFSLFGHFEQAALQEPRESWFPAPTKFLQSRNDVDAMREQGQRAAGYAIAPMFVWYFALQGICGFIALATALPFMKFEGAVHRWRVNLLIGAVLFVLIGWPLERRVHELRIPRNETMEAYLQDRKDPAKIDAKDEARAEFGRWHGYSVMVNLACILCVTAALALAGNLNGATTETLDEEAPVEPQS